MAEVSEGTQYVEDAQEQPADDQGLQHHKVSNLVLFYFFLYKGWQNNKHSQE